MLVCGGAVVARASAVQSLQPKSGTCWNKCKNKTISTKQTRNMSMDEYHGICCKVFDNKQSFFFTCGQYAIIIWYLTAITKQQEGLIHIQPEVYNSLQWSNIYEIRNEQNIQQRIKSTETFALALSIRSSEKEMISRRRFSALEEIFRTIYVGACKKFQYSWK